ncbi:MAG: flagellar hook-length control protein FliK [Nitrospirae bacterium]|nr:flagellar hook-length control protein FliK [Nitrospirota bacterium]
MINFKITSLVDGNLSLDMAQGKSVLLKPGEIVKAEVVNVQASGDAVLRIKGELITARTEVPLQPGDTAFFKVSDSPSSSPNQLRLQFMGYEDTSQGALLPENFMSTTEGQALATLIQQLSDSLSMHDGTASGGKSVDQQNSAQPEAQQGEMPAGSSRADTFPLDKVENLLKALPADINSLPQDVKTQLQDLLLSSLKTTGQGIQSRLDTVLNQLSDMLNNSQVAGNLKAEAGSVTANIGSQVAGNLKTDAGSFTANIGNLLADIGSFKDGSGNLKADIMINMDRLLSSSFKNAVLNTGVALEAKLKSEVFTMQANAIGPQEETAPSTTLPPSQQNTMGEELIITQADPSASKSEGQPGSTNDGKAGEIQPKEITHTIPSLQNDLKAVLLELKQRLSMVPDGSRPAQGPGASVSAKDTVHDAVALKNLQGTIEGLLKDIETFQALSKTTDSFYTFLPVNWKELKDGEVSFKRGRAGTAGGSSCSCRINLDLAESGNLSILVLMNNKDFFISFKADKPETHSVIDKNLDELKSSFIQKGMNLKAAHMLDQADTSMEKLDKLGSSERIISIKA